MSKKIILSLLIVLLSLFQPQLRTAHAERLENEQIVIEYEKSLQSVAEHIVRIYPALKADLEARYRAALNVRPTIQIIKKREAFQKIIGADPVVAVAIAKSNLIIIDNSKMKTHPFSLETTLKHELCHLFLHHYINGREMPRWLNEGICQSVSDGVAEILIGYNENLLSQAVLSNSLLPFKGLEKQFPSNERSLLLAYEQSSSLVKYIENEFGMDSVVQILQSLKKGKDIDEAVFHTLSVSVHELETHWIKHLKKRIIWATYISIHIYQILFACAGLLLVYGFVRLTIRRRAYKDEEDSESPDTNDDS